MKNLALYYFCVIALACAFVMPLQAVGQVFAPGPSPTVSAPGGSAGYSIPDPLGIKNFCDLVKTLLNIVMAIGVPVAVFFLVWAGFKFVLARGRPGELEIARKNFLYVIIGIAVFLGAWTLASVISTTIQSLGTNGSIPLCTNRS